MTEYLEKITENLKRIECEEAKKLAEASREVARVIKGGGLIFTFGCGHSHLPGLDAFYRAGGLANVHLCSTQTLCYITARQSQAVWKK